MVQVQSFDRVKVLPVDLAGLGIFYIVTGVAIIDFTTSVIDPDGWSRAPLEFLVPDESGNAMVFDSPFNSSDASCIVYPTSFANANSQDFGWAVDNASAITGLIPPYVRITADLAIRTDTNAILFRVGFQVNIHLF